MNTTKTFIKTAAALALVAGFGASHAQGNEERTQIQKPGSGLNTPQKAPIDSRSEAVTQKQQPSSGLMPKPFTPNTGVKVDETVSQTQRPGQTPPMAADSNTGRATGTTNRSVQMNPPVTNMNAQTGSTMNSGTMSSGSATSRDTMSSQQMMNEPMQRERMARSDRN